jgi:hypothetical protein
MLKENHSTKSPANFVIIRLSAILRLAVWAVVFVVTLPLEAKAYADPGAGTFLLQMLLVAIASGLFFMRTLKHRINLLLRRNQRIGATEDKERNDNRLSE